MAIKKPTIPDSSLFKATQFTQENSDMLKKPFFSFQYLQRHRHVEELEVPQQAELIKQLCILSQKTWQELMNAPRHGIGCETIKQVLNFSIPTNIASQTILSFRYSGKLAMVGFRDKNVFHVLGVDKDFNHNSCYGH